jgi:hypothetical protein
MNRSDTIANLATALAKAQGQMENAKKDSNNPFFKSKYADLSSVIEAIKKPFSDNGLSYTQCAEFDENNFVVVETIVFHESGEWISSKLRMRPTKEDPQGMGSCITYARRYGLQALVGLSAEDDDGNIASGNNQMAQKKNIPKAFISPHRPTDGAFEALSLNEQESITDLAIDVIAHVANGDVKEAIDVIKKAELDNDKKIALNSRLNSEVRSALKKFKDEADQL